eukprot:COSAG01_NODE_4631_length_4863_cov_3.415407_4_plen_153_part_01
MRFVGAKGRSYTGDMAIDNIVIRQSVAIPGNPMGKLIWERGSSTPNKNTGPAKAHSGKDFMFVDASIGRAGLASYLTTAPIPLAASSMQFYYHMYGATIGTLFVQVLGRYGKWYNVSWSREGQQHSSSNAEWSVAKVELPQWTTRARFVATRV